MTKDAQYLNPTTREVMAWMDSGLCVWCGQKDQDGCHARYCDSCSETWLADSEASYREFDKGDRAVIAPAKEDCPSCREWLATTHLENPALSPTTPDWMEVL